MFRETSLKINDVRTFLSIFLFLSKPQTVYCRSSGWLYSPVRMRNSSQKKSHKFRRLPLCSILYFNLMEFSENRDKEFQLGLMPFLKLGTLSPAAHFLNCVHIGRSQTIAAIICGLSSGKRFVKLREVF